MIRFFLFAFSALLAACTLGSEVLLPYSQAAPMQSAQAKKSQYQRRLRGGTSDESRSDPNRVTIPLDSPQLLLIKTEVAQVTETPVDEVIAPGRIEFDIGRISRVLLPVPGRIEQVHVHLGDNVKAGQPLLVVDSPEAADAVAEWQQAISTQTQAKATLAKSAADHERKSDLLAHQAIARKELLTAEYELAQARTSLEQAQASLERARRRLEILGLDPEDPGQKVQVRAPISGKVIDMAVTPGEYRTETTAPSLTLADLSQVWVTSEVPEKMIRFVEVGEKVEVTLVAYPGEVFTARVARIADTVDSRTRTIRVQASLPNPRGRLRPEMYGTIRHAHGQRALPLVPAGAVVRHGEESVVFVERDRGVFERRIVRLGNALDDKVPILGGLEAGERIVVQGSVLLSSLLGR